MMTENVESTGQQPAQAGEARRGRTWLWIGLAVVLVVIGPVAACGALGFGLSRGSFSTTNSAILGPAVGVIRVEGVIAGGESDAFQTSAGSETIVDLIEQAAADSSIHAVVLRVDSPGGGVVASDEIYHALTQLDKPLVVSMGSLAASGGYYISAPADYIYATPHTLTGSIGVISQFVTAEELLDDIGVEVVVITAGESKDFGSMSRDMTEEERTYWQALLEETHDAFIQIVADGRGMSVQQVREFADGRVFTGQQALDLGLVDEIGYFDDAIQKAAALGGISGDPRIVELTPDVSLLDSLYGVQARQRPGATLETLRTLAMPTFEFRMVSP
jgi:protease-4